MKENNLYNNNMAGATKDSKSPCLFTKKIKTNYKLVPFKISVNHSGKVKYLPPVAKEWKNSVYNYNSKNVINYPLYDMKVNSLIKSYFNLYFNTKFIQSKYIPHKQKRKSFNKIFVSKAEIKHTNTKAIITIYIYNRERYVLMRKIRKLALGFWLKYRNGVKLSKSFLVKTLLNTPTVLLSKVNRINKSKKPSWVKKSTVMKVINPVVLRIQNFCGSNNIFTWLIQNKNLINSGSSIKPKLNKDWLEKKLNIILSYHQKKFIIETYKLVGQIRRFRFRLSLNLRKFENRFLYKLSQWISKYYGKKVEFNIVNLKSIAYNGDIFTDILTTRIKKEQSHPMRSVNALLSKVFFPKVNRIIERSRVVKNVDFNLVDNKFKNLNISSIIHSNNLEFAAKDNLNKLLYDIQPKTKKEIKQKNLVRSSSKASLEKMRNIIFENIKYKNMAGVKVRVKGRLTRRYRADRAVYKLKWRGGLKNLDSAFKGLSSVVFKGYQDANVEKSQLVSKRRIGSYGVKVWFSGK